MKFVIISLVYIYTLSIIPAWGQNLFNSVPITLGQKNQSRLFDTYPDSSLIYVIGDLMDTIIDPLNPQVRPWFGTFNYQGELISSNVLYSDQIPGEIEVQGSSRIIKNEMGKLFYWCQFFDSTGFSSAVILKIDPTTGELENTRLFYNPISSSNYLVPNWFNYDELTGNILLGCKIDIDDIPRNYIIRIDSNFNDINSFIIKDNGRNNFIHYFEHDADSTLILIGESYKRGDNTPSPDAKPYYMRVNSNGDILKFQLAAGISDKTVGFSTADVFPVSRDTYGNWIFSAISYFRSGGCPDCWYTYPYVYSYNEDFSVLNWRKNFSYDIEDKQQKNQLYSTAFDSISHTFLVVGIDVNLNHSQSYLFKITDGGDSLWTRHYIPLNWNPDSIGWAILNDLKIAKNNTYVSVGCASTRPELFWRSWIISMDTFGCIVPGCQLSVNTQDLNEGEILKSFKIYPNPATNFLGLLCKESYSNLRIILFDINGRILENTTLDAKLGYQYIFNVADLTSGIYFIRIENSDGKLIQEEKVIVN